MTAASLERDQLTALFAQAPGFMAINSGPNFVFEFVNKAYADLVGNRELIGLTVREAMPELEGQGLFELLEEVYATGKPFVGHEIHAAVRRAPDEQPSDLVFDFVYQPILDQRGAVRGIFVQGHEVTERVAARHRAESLQAVHIRESKQGGMDAMSATLAHELNQPLTIIANTVRAARNLLANPGPANLLEATSALADVESAALRAGELIRRLRDTVSRGHVRNHPEMLATIVADAVTLTASALRRSKVECRVAIAADIAVCGDRIQLQQVVLNLINNAIEALHACPVRAIDIHARAEGAFAVLCVDDTGVGLGDDARPHMFDAMFTTKASGLGLGLSICRAIIEAHGGTIRCGESATGGASFCVKIPLVGGDRS